GDGDELETLGDPSPGCGGVKDVNVRGDAVFLCRLQNVRHGVGELFVVAVQHRLFAHRIVKVVRADERDVHPWPAEDFVGGLDRLDVFDHERHEDLVVGPGVVGRGVGVKVGGVQLAADGPFAHRLVAGGADGGFRLGARVDHRHNDSVGAGVQDALDVFARVPRDPGERNAIV